MNKITGKKLNKLYGDKAYSYKKRMKGAGKKHNNRLVRRRLNRDLEV